MAKERKKIQLLSRVTLFNQKESLLVIEFPCGVRKKVENTSLYLRPLLGPFRIVSLIVFLHTGPNGKTNKSNNNKKAPHGFPEILHFHSTAMGLWKENRFPSPQIVSDLSQHLGHCKGGPTRPRLPSVVQKGIRLNMRKVVSLQPSRPLLVHKLVTKPVYWLCLSLFFWNNAMEKSVPIQKEIASGKSSTLR